MRRLAWGVGSAVLGVLASTMVALGSARSVPARAAADAPVVRVARRDIVTVVKATGVIRPRVGAEVRVGSRISGVVKRLYVQIGDAVRKGQLLAELDDQDLVARRDEATATLQRMEASLAYARTDLRRKIQLHAAGAIATSDLDVAERECSIAEQQVKEARASVAFAAAQVGYARVIAPITGLVASVTTQEGETVAASFAAPTFLTLLDPSRLEVRAYVDETDIGRIQTGQEARFTVDTYGGHEFDGRVTAVYPSAEIRDNVVNYVTVVRFAPPTDRVLRPEMTTTVRIGLAARTHVLTIPVRAAHWTDGRAYVLLRQHGGGGGAIERRWIRTGSRDDRYLEVIDGVREGDEVVMADARAEQGEQP